MITRDAVIRKMNREDGFCVNLLLALYERQTADEQATDATRENNGVGFNGTDANILSSFARQALDNRANAAAGLRSYPTDLSPKQIGLARTKLAKYAGQLTDLVNARIAEREAMIRPQFGNDEGIVANEEYAARQSDPSPYGELPAITYTPLPAHLLHTVREEVDLGSAPFRTPCCTLIRDGLDLRFPTAKDLWENGGREEFNGGVDRWFKDREGVVVGGRPANVIAADPFDLGLDL